MGREIAAAILLHLQGRKVERLLALQLQLGMLDHRVLTHAQLSHRVGPIDMVLQANVALDNRRLAVVPHDDEVARVGQGGLPVRGGKEQQVDRRRKDQALRDVHERAVLHESRVESDKGVVLVAGVLSQVRLYPPWIGVHGRGETPGLHAVRQRPQERELLRVITIDKHELSARPLPEGGPCEPLSRQPIKLISSRLESNLHQWGYVGILPLLMPSGGEPQVGKAGDRRFAKLGDPGRPLSSAVLLELLKIREIPL